MVRLSIKTMLATAAVVAGPIAAEAPAHAPPTSKIVTERRFVMFGASWCAPCIAELRDITAIAGAARPDRVVIAWTDRGIRNYRRPLPTNVEIAPLPVAKDLSRQFASGGIGLPYTVLLDERSRKCAAINVRLTAGVIGALRRACGGRVG